jgi:hypothetical protein
MTGDHHGRTASRATLQVTAADEILGTHSIKRIKRDGYGRANFDLLRAQILIAA